MALVQGTKVGVYEVVATLGRGGMGEVYRARDGRLHRDVALKVLPDSFAADAERLARFQREAQVLASLNHPCIASIYGIEQSPDSGGDVRALVLELVEGPTLADRIALGPVSIDEARPIARQIAQALEAAHEQGIIHRDLKPANIKVRDDGTVKVLDFGLAKALDPPGERADLSQSPTITTPAATQAGVLLGTAAYMSPELAKGRAADKRSDIWSFGCVLFEMLAGTPAFDGEDMADVLGAVVRLEPNWQALPHTVPPDVLWVLARCLQKDPKLRMRDIADVRSLIDDGPGAALSSAGPVSRGRNVAGYAGWAVAVLVAIAAAAFVPFLSRPAAEMPETRLEIVTPPSDDPFSVAISPDGRSVAFRARQDDRSLLWLRSLQLEESRPLAGTEGAASPFWSPDSRSVAFFADGTLKRIDLPSGFVRTVASAPNPRRGAWNQDGTIFYGALAVCIWVRSPTGACGACSAGSPPTRSYLPITS